MQPNHHSNELLNIASGKIERDLGVNVTDGVGVGKEQMREFYATFPDGFYLLIKKES